MLNKLVILLVTVVITVRCDFYKKCADNIGCFEGDLIKYVDEIDSNVSMPVLGDFVVVQKIDDYQTPRSGEGFYERCLRYLVDHELKIRIPKFEAKSILGEARTSKLKKIILPILLLLKLKAAIIIPAVLSIIGLIAFKGLGASLIALAISGATGLKSLLENQGSKLTYEVVPSIPSPHWSRNGLDQQQGYYTIP